MIPRKAKRAYDERGEPRIDAESQTAVLEHRGRKHVVRLVNLSASGAMVIFASTPHIGEEIRLQLIGRAPVVARIQWVKNGRIGVSFAASLEARPWR